MVEVQQMQYICTRTDYMKTFSFLGYKPRISTPFDNPCFLTAVSNDSDCNDSILLFLRFLKILEIDKKIFEKKFH